MKTYEIIYAKSLRNIATGDEVTLETLDYTHVYLKGIEAESLDDVFCKMNNWSDNDLIKDKGLNHTSMSVGDVIYDDGIYHVVVLFGFKQLNKAPVVEEVAETSTVEKVETPVDVPADRIAGSCQSDMEQDLKSNFDYISMYKAIKYLKPLYNYIGKSWLHLAIQAWKGCNYGY